MPGRRPGYHGRCAQLLLTGRQHAPTWLGAQTTRVARYIPSEQQARAARLAPPVACGSMRPGERLDRTHACKPGKPHLGRSWPANQEQLLLLRRRKSTPPNIICSHENPCYLRACMPAVCIGTHARAQTPHAGTFVHVPPNPNPPRTIASDESSASSVARPCHCRTPRACK